MTPLSNEAWRGGNETHAQDMFSNYHGTAVDTSHLIDYIGAYVFPEDRVKITRHLVMGISLGGPCGVALFDAGSADIGRGYRGWVSGLCADDERPCEIE